MQLLLMMLKCFKSSRIEYRTPVKLSTLFSFCFSISLIILFSSKAMFNISTRSPLMAIKTRRICAIVNSLKCFEPLMASHSSMNTRMTTTLVDSWNQWRMRVNNFLKLTISDFFKLNIKLVLKLGKLAAWLNSPRK